MLSLLLSVGKLLFDNPLGRLAALGMGVLVLIGSFAWDQRSRGAANAVAKINDQSKKLVDAARKARAPAAQPGAADRLRNHSCRDC